MSGPKDTKVVVVHARTPPEPKEVWWFSVGAAVVVAFLSTLLATYLAGRLVGGIIQVIVSGFMANDLCLMYLIVGWSCCYMVSDNRHNFAANGMKVAMYVLVVPWIISVLVVVVGLKITAIVGGYLLLLYIGIVFDDDFSSV